MSRIRRRDGLSGVSRVPNFMSNHLLPEVDGRLTDFRGPIVNPFASGLPTIQLKLWWAMLAVVHRFAAIQKAGCQIRSAAPFETCTTPQ
jgi:hypothetical protein